MQFKEIYSHARQIEYIQKGKEKFHYYVSLGKPEEALLRQKSRVCWINLGDQNSSYFHK